MTAPSQLGAGSLAGRRRARVRRRSAPAFKKARGDESCRSEAKWREFQIFFGARHPGDSIV